MLILVVAVSMTMGASAASYIPDDVTYQNLNGQQLAIKTYTLLPDQDPLKEVIYDRQQRL